MFTCSMHVVLPSTLHFRSSSSLRVRLSFSDRISGLTSSALGRTIGNTLPSWRSLRERATYVVTSQAYKVFCSSTYGEPQKVGTPILYLKGMRILMFRLLASTTSHDSNHGKVVSRTPSTLNYPKPSTLNPKPLNPKPLNP